MTEFAKKNMRVVLLPVCQIDSYPHVLLKYDFQTVPLLTPTTPETPINSTHVPKFELTPYWSTISTSGSIQTVCEIIQQSDILRQLFDIDDKNQEDVMKKIDFKGHGRFIAFGPEIDVCICVLFVRHISSVELNYLNQPDPPLSRQNSTLSYVRSLSSATNTGTDFMSRYSSWNHLSARSFVERDVVHLWISLRDIIHKLVQIDRILKQRGILSKLIDIESWTKTYDRCNIESINKINIDRTLQLVKARARTLVWDIMEMKNEILYAHPVHGRIPNFRNSPYCSTNIAQIEEFQRARIMLIGPSLAQEHLRLFSLSQGKIVLIPAPSMPDAPFYKLDPKFLRTHDLARAATKSGAAALGNVVTLAAVGNIHVDIFVVASVVVNPFSGARLGRGKGYGDIEYAMMHQLGACNEKTLVITTVHESQLLNDLPSSIMTRHDLPVDIVVTPERVIYTENKFSRPTTIDWTHTDNETLSNLPVLKQFQRSFSSTT